MLLIEVCIDVPSLDDGKRFYTEAFGLVEEPSPVTNVAVLAAENVRICLLAKPEGTKPAPSAADLRRYQRHWTPVHLDVRVTDIDRALEQALSAGATQESQIQADEHGSWVACADPFGHGFCFIQPKVPS